MNIYDVAELQQYLNPQVNQQSTQLIDPTMLFPQRSPLLGIQSQRLVDPSRLIPQIPGGITASSVDIVQGFTRNTPSDQGTNFQFLPSANEDETDEIEEKKRSAGIASLFEFLSNLPTPINLLRRGLESLSGINQRIRGTDFGQSKTLAEYFQKRRDKKAREDAAKLGASKQRIKDLRAFNEGAGKYFGGRDDGDSGRAGGFGKGAGSFSSSNPTATEGSF